MRKSILHGFWRGVIAVGLGALLAPVVIHLLVEPISAGDGFFGNSWWWFWDEFFAFLPVIAVPVAIYALITRYLGPGYPRARRAFLRERKFIVASCGRVRIGVVAVLLALTFYTALIIPLSFEHVLLSWRAGGTSTQSVRWQGSVQRGDIHVYRFAPDPGPSRLIAGPSDWLVVGYASYVAPPPLQIGIGPFPPEHATSVWVSTWAVLAVFAVYPLIVIVSFLRGPLRQRRRQEKGLCVACGYNLAGSVEPRCPECGQPSIAPQSGAQQPRPSRL